MCFKKNQLLIILLFGFHFIFGQIPDSLFYSSFINDSSLSDKPDSIIFSEWNLNAAQWRYIWKDEFIYEANSLKQSQTNYIWLSNQWISNYKNVYGYSGGLLENKIYSFWDDYNMDWILKDKYIYGYDSINQLYSILDMKHSSILQNWINDSLFSFKYNENKDLTKICVYTWTANGNNWENSSETIFEYNNGKNTKEVFWLWDFDYLIYEPQWIHEKHYNSKNILDQETQLVMNYSHTSWLNDWRNSFLYFENGKLQEETYLDWNAMLNQWEEITKESYQYDNDLNLANKFIYSFDWDQLIWVNKVKTINEYNNINQLVSSTQYTWQSNNWVPYYKYQYYYPEIQTVEGSEAQIKIIVYPNPCNDKITIQFNEPVESNTVLNLFDLTGKLVLKQSISSNEYYQEVKIPKMKSGLYILTVIMNNQLLTQKIEIIN